MTWNSSLSTAHRFGVRGAECQRACDGLFGELPQIGSTLSGRALRLQSCST